MKITPIKPYYTSFKNNSSNLTDKPNSPKAFYEENKKPIIYTIGGIALATIGILAGKRINQNIKYNNLIKKINTELNSVPIDKGLNKLTENQELATTLKKQIFLPFIGEKHGLNFAAEKSLPNGTTIETLGAKVIEGIKEAFLEHAGLLGFRTVKVNHSSAKFPDDYAKNIQTAFREAKEHFSNTKQYTFIDVGDLDKFALKTKENINYLESTNSLKPLFINSSERGIFWLGHGSDFTRLDGPLLSRGSEFNLLGKSI